MIFKNRIHEILDLVKSEIEYITKENLNLQKSLKDSEERNRRLMTENKRLDFIIKDMHKAISESRSVNQSDSSNPSVIPKKLKIGSDWAVTGDKIADISLLKKFYLINPIERCCISTDSSFVLFAYGNSCYYLLVEEEILFVLNIERERFEKTCIYDLRKFDAVKKKGKIQFSLLSNEKEVIVLYDNKIYTKWNLESMELLCKMTILDINASYMISGSLFYLSFENKIYVHDNETRMLQKLEMKDRPVALKIAKAQNFAFLKITDKENLFVNLETGKMRKFFFSKSVEQLSLSDDGSLALARYDDGTFNVYKINYEDFEFDCVSQSLNSQGSFIQCSFMKNPRYVLAASRNKSMVMIDLKKHLACYLTGFYENILYFKHNERVFCTACADGRLRIWYYNQNLI